VAEPRFGERRRFRSLDLLQRRLAKRIGPEMRSKEPVANPRSGETWTRPEAYIVGLARKRSFRRTRGERQRTQPEAPRLLLSTLPFLVLIALLAVLGVAIMVAAFPGSQPRPRPKEAAAKEQGVAPRGWFQHAQKEMHR
jgi:hypothetical protein